MSGPRMVGPGSIKVHAESRSPAMCSRPGVGLLLCGQQRGGCAGSALCADERVSMHLSLEREHNQVA